MPTVRISLEAENDLDCILAHTVKEWGTHQADRYFGVLEAAFELLAANPLMGGGCDKLHPGLHRFEVESHVVFYLPEPDGVFIVRVLLEHMLPTRYF